MYKFILLAASAAFASAYTTPTTQCTDGCNPIAKPGLNEIVPAGQAYTITWQPTTAGTVSIVFLKGPSANIIPQFAIAEKIANTGSYTWTPPTDLEPTGNSGYGLQLINDANGQYQWSTQFGIANNGYGPVISASASASASAQASARASAAGNGTISASAAPSSAAPSALSNSTVTFSSIAAAKTHFSTILSTASRTAGGASSTSARPAQSTNGAAALGLSMAGAFVAAMAAVVAL